jgi:hypothetical protein
VQVQCRIEKGKKTMSFGKGGKEKEKKGKSALLLRPDKHRKMSLPNASMWRVLEMRKSLFSLPPSPFLPLTPTNHTQTTQK